MNEVKELPANRQNKVAMPIGNFTMIANVVLLDTRISYKARGIFCLILSRPKDWKIYVDELTSKSEKDGKRAIQSGLKELLQQNYIELAPTYDAKGRFKGTHYRVVQPSLFLNRQSGFRTVRKMDSPKTGQFENAAVLKSDHPKTASLTNTNSSNTNNSKTKQQQQIKPVAADFEISIFYEKLLEDTSWQELFIGQAISDKLNLNAADFKILLQHFKTTSEKSGNRYVDIQAVKKHFANWFHANFKKGALVTYLEQYHTKQRTLQNKAIRLVPKSENIFYRLIGRKCSDLKHVQISIKKLKEHRVVYAAALPYLAESKEKGIKILMEDIDRLLQKVERAKAKNQLMWFCGNVSVSSKEASSTTILEKAEKRLQVLKSGIIPISPMVRRELIEYLNKIESLSTPKSKQIAIQIKQILVVKNRRQQSVLQSA